jgi:hypothetical protein
MEGAATEMPDGAVQLRVDTWLHGRRQAVAPRTCETFQGSRGSDALKALPRINRE